MTGKQSKYFYSPLMTETEWDEVAEVKFQEWFNELYGVYSHRCEWFYGDCEVEDEKTRKDLMIKWLHSAYLSGYNVGRCPND